MTVDLISGVMAAVNQTNAKVAFQSLPKYSAGRVQNAMEFASLLAKKQGVETAMAAEPNDLAAAPKLAAATQPTSEQDKKKQAMVQLEGTLMTKMVDQMMPKDEHGLYGGGVAGEIWRGFAVDKFGQIAAQSDLLHFARNAPAAHSVGLFASQEAVPLTAAKITPFSG